MISVHFQGNPFNITVIQFYALTSNVEEDEVEWFYEPTKLSRTNTQKRCPFHFRGLECKSRKSEIPVVRGIVGRGVEHEAKQRLIEFCHENALVIATPLFQQHKRRLYT